MEYFRFILENVTIGSALKADPAQPLPTAGEELDHPCHDLSQMIYLSEVCDTFAFFSKILLKLHFGFNFVVHTSTWYEIQERHYSTVMVPP